METGLEKMRTKIMEDSTYWRQITWQEDADGDGRSIWYCECQDLTCFMEYVKDMDQEFYLNSIIFYNGKEFVEEVD